MSRGSLESVPLWSLLSSRDEVGALGLPVLTVKSDAGVSVRDLEAGGRAVSEDLGAYRVVRPADLVVNKMWARFGAYGVAEDAGLVSPAYWVMQIDQDRVSPRFLHYLLRSDPWRGEVWRRSKDQPPNGFDISWDQFRSIRVPLPELADQRKIADFLDEHVARIDSLAAGRERQIALLDEATRAEANDLFARFSRQYGLVPLRRLVRGIEQGGSPNAGEAGGPEDFAVLKTSAIKAGRFDPLENKALLDAAEFEPRYEVRDGDVLVVRGSGSGDLVADVAQAHLPLGAPRIMLSDLVYRLVGLDALPAFVVAAFLSPQARSQMRSLVRQGSGPAKARGEDVLAIQIPRATPEGQAEFASGYWRLREQITRVSQFSLDSLALLSEYKRSLITAAVTGELDVTTSRPEVLA